MKYIVVTGGVVSGLGKGITISSIGRILKSSGVNVTAIKIDPYLNVDAGTMSPYEHGETFVLDDGGETDLDLGNYERFLDISLSGKHNITTGKIYKEVIFQERRGDYLGKTVQIVPHATDRIQEWIEDIAKKPVDGSSQTPEVCLIEVGGTVGDIESMVFLEALRQFQFRVGRENFLLVHVSLVPVLGSVGEQKTKPTQHSVKELRSLGLSPDVIICRSASRLEESTRAKLGTFCQVDPGHTLAVHDVSNIYHVPLILVEQGIHTIIRNGLSLTGMSEEPDLVAWTAMARGVDAVEETVKIAMVGKYTALSDAYLSVTKALTHCGIHLQIRVDVAWVDASHLEPDTQEKDPVAYEQAWEDLESASGVLVPGGFGNRGVEGKILAANYCRINQKPYLGVCLGMQVMVLEFVRNALGKEKANSEEFDKDAEHKAVVFMPEIDQETMGGNMRLGARPTVIRSEIDRAPTLASTIYSVQDNAREGKGGDNDDHERWILERHRHRYEVNPSFISAIEDKGLYFTGKDTKSERMEIAELPQAKHPFYFGVQFHPEFKSRPNRPSPPFFGFVVAALRYEDSHHAKKDGEAKDGKVSTGKRNLSEAGQLFQLHEQDTSPYKKMKRSFSGLIKNFI